METEKEKRGYLRAIAILEKDLELRQAINPSDPALTGLLLALSCLRLYQDKPYIEEKSHGLRKTGQTG